MYDAVLSPRPTLPDPEDAARCTCGEHPCAFIRKAERNPTAGWRGPDGTVHRLIDRAPRPPRATPAEIRRLATILGEWGEPDVAEKLNRMAADREPLRSLGEEGGIVASLPVVVRAHRGYLLLGVE